MTPRWTARILACAALLLVWACAAAQPPERTFTANEVQVVEPAGEEDRWTYAPNVLTVAKGRW